MKHFVYIYLSMPFPCQCPDHALSIGEYTRRFLWYRAYYRDIYNGDEDVVAAELVNMCESFNITGPCCRNMLLNVETTENFIHRRNTYKTKTDAKAGAKTDAKADAKAGAKTDAKAGAKTDAKAKT